MTALLIPGLVAMAAVTLTYLFCIRPMRHGGHCGMPSMGRSKNCSDTDLEIQNLRAELADLRRVFGKEEAANGTAPTDAPPSLKPSH